MLAADLSQIEFAILYHAFWCLAYAVFDLDRKDAAIYVTMGIQLANFGLTAVSSKDILQKSYNKAAMKNLLSMGI